MPGVPLDATAMTRRATQELFPGAVVALGMGLPCHIPSEVPAAGVWFIADSGLLGNDGINANADTLDAGGNPVATGFGGHLHLPGDLPREPLGQSLFRHRRLGGGLRSRGAGCDLGGVKGKGY